MNVLDLKGIGRSYGPAKEALKGVDFQVAAGQIVGLLGRNGAGKTSLLRIATGIIQPHAGSVRVFGMDPWQHPVQAKARLGYVGETHPVPQGVTVRSLLDFYASMYPSWDPELERRLLGRLALREDAKLAQLSKGEARKAILISAMAHRPELLILDEPAGGLDPAARREFLELSIELLNTDGSAIVFSSHHMGDVERIAERVVIIDEGEVLLDTSLDALRETYTLAIVPGAEHATLATLNGSSGLVRVRKRSDSAYAVFSRQPEEVEELLEVALKIHGAHCARASLEELFVALVGGEP